MAQDNIFLNKTKSIINKLSHLSSSVGEIHEAEKYILNALLELGGQLLQNHINKVSENLDQKEFIQANKEYKNKGTSTRTYLSIFGEILIKRLRAYNPLTKKSVFPLDHALGLPSDKTSYLLKDWLIHSSTDKDFDSSCEMVNRILNFDFQAMEILRMSNSLKLSAKDYYTDIALASCENTEQLVCFSADGKGVPIRASEVNREVDSSAVRLGKGQKNGVKREVTVNYNCEVRKRDVKTVINSFFKQEEINELPNNQKKNESSKIKHLSGYLSNQKEAIHYGLSRLKATSTKKQSCIVLLDGARGLEKAVNKAIIELGITGRIKAKILDFVHVTEYVWKVANSLMNEKNKGRIAWVKNVCKEILKGNTYKIIIKFKKLVEQGMFNEITLTKSNKKQIEKAIKYFENHTHMMEYNKYLEAGMPISTGVVESACGYFIQQRFDCNGMRWTKEGVQNLINLRAIKLNDNWTDFFETHIRNENKKLYSEINQAA
jgi:hypothetical protein